ALDPDDPMVGPYLASALIEEGRHDEALALAEQALARGVDHVLYRVARAHALDAVGREAEATEAWRELVGRGVPITHFAVAWARAGRIDDGERLLRAHLARRPADRFAWAARFE